MGESVENLEELKLSATYWISTEVVSTESTDDSYSSTIAVDGAGNAYVVWHDYTNYDGSGTDDDIFYKRWNATSNTWTTTEVVSTESTDDSYDPTIAVDGAGNVHVTWEDITDYSGSGTDYDIFYKRWNASSSTWTTTEVVSTESTDTSGSGMIAVDGARNVHMAWHDYTNYDGSGTDLDIFYKRWNATSSSWTTTEVVSTESTGFSAFPTIAMDSTGNAHVAWYDITNYGGSGTDYDIFYKRWNATSSTWTTTEVVSTESTGSSITPTIAVDGTGNIHVVWYDMTNYGGSGTDYDIFYKRWNATSSTWTTTEVVSTESTSYSYSSTIAVDSVGNVQVAWEDMTNYGGSGTDEDIFYKRWNATSNTWATTEVVSTESTGDSNSPTIAVDGAGNVHVAWYDITNYGGSGTDVDIFYKRLIPSPEIIIYSPGQNALFGSVAPNFEIAINGSYLDTTWYTLDDGITNITFSGLTGTIDQEEWDKQDVGNITIQFYVNDTFGEKAYAEVIVRKELFEYYNTWGGINLDEGHDMAIDSSNNVYVVGKTASFTVGGYDIFLVKYNSSGVQEWNRTWGEANNDEGYGIALDSTGNIYVVGINVVTVGTDNDMVLVKYNSFGVQQWNRTWGGGSDERGYDVAVDDSGNIFVTGITVSFGPGECGTFLVKYNSSGTQQWNRTWGGTYREYGNAIALSSSGNIYLAGSTGSYGPPNTNLFLVKFNSSGDWQWSQFWGGGAIEGASDIVVDLQENIYVAGSTNSFGSGGYDTVLIKYNSSGTQLWNRTWGGTLDDNLASIVLDSLGNIYLTGSTRSYGAEGKDVLLMKYNNTGTLQWNRTWGGSLDDQGNAIGLDSYEDLFVAGYTESFGAVNKDMVLIKFDNNAPIITVNSPIQFDYFGISAPTFNITITEPNLHSAWYTLDNGITNFTLNGLTGTINQTEWEKFGNGSVTIKFYANDTYGFVSHTNVKVYKDTIAPISSLFFTPHNITNYVNRSTVFTLNANDGSGSGVSLLRYKINNSAWIDYISPFDLSSYALGDYIISYYAIDLTGNIESENIILVTLVEIETPPDPPPDPPPEPPPPSPGIPGFELISLLVVTVLVMVIVINRKFKN